MEKKNRVVLSDAIVSIDEHPYEVPNNWCWIKLGAISSIISKGTTPKGGKSAYVDEGIDFLRVENINDDGTICHDNMMHVTEETHTGFLKRSILEENDVLVSIAGTLGKTAIVKKDDLPLNTNQAVAFVRLADNGEISREYIRYAIDTPVIQNMLLSKTKVTAIPNLTLEIISECLIPLPPLAEQKRIVEQIENLFARLDEAREKAQMAVESFENVQKAIMYDAFVGKLTAKWRSEKGRSIDTWKKYSIQEVCTTKITDGTHKTPTYCEKEDGGIPFISSKDVTSKRICWDNIKYITPELHEELYARLAPQIDDVLLAKNGTTGVAAIVEDDRVFDLYVTLAVLRPNKDIIKPRYLLNIVNSPICKNQFDEHLTGIGVPNLHLRDIKEISVMVPELDEQEEVVRLLDSIIEKEEKAAETAEKTIEAIDMMKKSILAKAFRGELGTNIPQEESAIELLKTILDKGEC